MPTIPANLPWDESVHATAVVSGSYEELLLFTVVPLIALYKTFYIMKTWAEWPMAFIYKYSPLALLLSYVSYDAMFCSKFIELMVIYPLAMLRHENWKYEQVPKVDGLWG